MEEFRAIYGYLLKLAHDHPEDNVTSETIEVEKKSWNIKSPSNLPAGC